MFHRISEKLVLLALLLVVNYFIERYNLHNATQQPQYIPVPVPQQGQICNAYGCGVSPNQYGASPYGVCTQYGCP